ncbi:hypothetical protein [Flagellimonas sp. GZD32]|uniref:hypothetical protein n=1 Tax=Flagellimonas cixiensis TaxID=3228750 RepID=UPI0035C8B055
MCAGALLAQNQYTDTTVNRIVKGSKYLNLSFSLDQKNAENENQLLQQIEDQDKLEYNITVSSGYALKNNFTVGLGGRYGREREDITDINSEGAEIKRRGY